MKEKINRRTFLKNTAVAGAALSLSANTIRSFAEASANEKVVVAVAGIRDRGNFLTSKFAGYNNCEVKYVIDVDRRYLEKAVDTAFKAQQKKPFALTDFRKALEDNDVDALVIATPDHWHAPMTIEALKAGKHVYLEKPCSHNPAEGEMLVKAQKKYGKLVQMGNQRRSMAVAQRMVEEIKEGIIGNVYFAKTWYANNRGPIGFGKKIDVPDYLNWELWQGPAPRLPYRSNVHPYNWHWFWHWGTGEALNNGTHEIDVARWALGVDFPKKVVSLGGRYNFVGEDDWECPDTQTITIEFEQGKSIFWEGRSCNNYPIEGDGRGVILYGTKGTIVYLAHSYKVFGLDNKLVKTVGRREAAADSTNTTDPGLADNHAGNFIESIRGNSKLTSPIDQGHKSVLLCQLGNIALRTNSVINCDPKTGRILNNPAAEKLWSREYEPAWEPKI